MVGPVGFEPTTSGPDFSGSPAPQVYRPTLDSGILWAGSIPLTKLDDGPQSVESNRPAFLCYAQRSFDRGPWDRRRGLLRRGNRDLHDCLLDWITLFSPAFHPVKHLFHFETKSSQFRGSFNGCVAEDTITICHQYLVSE